MKFDGMCIYLARSFNFTFRYIDDVLLLNNFRLGDFVDRISPIELEIKDTTDMSASYLDLHLEIDSEGRLRTKLYEKISIVPYPFIEEEQTTQWPKEKVQKDKQRSRKHTFKTKDRVTRTPLKTEGEIRFSGRVSSSCFTSVAYLSDQPDTRIACIAMFVNGSKRN
jgi:hypothetical protein